MARSEWAPRRPELQTPSDEEARYTSRVARTRKHLRLPTQKLGNWELWCKVNHKDFQDLVEEAIDFYFYNLDAQAPTIRSDDLDRSMTPSSSRSSTGRPDAHSPTFGDDAEKQILRFYCVATGNRLKETDKNVYRAKFANLAPHVVKEGIVTSVLRNAMSSSATRINSLNYCVSAVEEVAESGSTERRLQMLVWAVEHRPMYRDAVPPITRDNLLRAFALQPTLPGMGADVLPMEKGNTE